MDRPSYRPDDEREYLARGWWRDDDTLWQWLRRHASYSSSSTSPSRASAR